MLFVRALTVKDSRENAVPSDTGNPHLCVTEQVSDESTVCHADPSMKRFH